MLGSAVPTLGAPNHISTRSIDRFWSKVNLNPTPFGCLEWTGSKNHGGYGVIRWHNSRHTVTATRVVMELTYGILPGPEFVIRHLCDNPPCVNPDHLLPGTYAENSRDMVDRGRSLVGERHGRCTLTESRVIEARRRHAAGESISALSREFGVKERTLNDAVRSVTWRHVEVAV